MTLYNTTRPIVTTNTTGLLMDGQQVFIVRRFLDHTAHMLQMLRISNFTLRSIRLRRFSRAHAAGLTAEGEHPLAVSWLLGC